MGQSSVIFAFAATLVVAIVLLTSQRSNQATDVTVAEYHNSVLSREAAMTGHNLTVRRLVDEPDNWFSNTSDYEFPATAYASASFVVNVTSTHPDSVFVVATGTQHGVDHRIEAVYAKGLISGGIAEVFTYAVVSEEDLRFNGSTNILAADGSNNANVHANEDLTSNGNNVSVEGYGTHGTTGTVTVNPAAQTDNIFDPNIDGNGGNLNVFGADDVDIPLIDPSLYATSPPADLVIAGDHSLIDMDRAWLTANGYPATVGTVAHPFLIYVGGDLSASGNVIIDGIYFQAVVAGDITLSGSVSTSAIPAPGRNASQAVWDAWIAANLDASGNTTIGLFSGGDITLNGNVSVTGQLYANDDVTINGGGGRTRNILGGIVSASSDITLNGGITIQYAQLSTTGLLEEFESDIPEGVRLVDWAEF